MALLSLEGLLGVNALTEMMFAALAAVAPVASPVIAQLPMSESSFDARPASWVNVAPGGLTFSNRGSNGVLGGQSWFAGEGPFGQGVKMQSASSSTCAVVCDQPVTVTKGLTHECFLFDFDSTGRPVWEIRENVANPTYRIRLKPERLSDGTWKLVLIAQMPGSSSATACETTPFTPVTTGNGNRIITQWTDDGFFEVWVNDVRLAVSAAAYSGTLADCLFVIYGEYNGTYAGGMFNSLVGEFRFSKKQQYIYTGAALPPQTARFPIP